MRLAPVALPTDRPSSRSDPQEPARETYDTAVEIAARHLASQAPCGEDVMTAERALAAAIAVSLARMATYITNQARQESERE